MEIKALINILPIFIWLASLDSSFKSLLKNLYLEILPYVLKPGQKFLLSAPTDSIIMYFFYHFRLHTLWGFVIIVLDQLSLPDWKIHKGKDYLFAISKLYQYLTPVL